jgi:DNA ligase-4
MVALARAKDVSIEDIDSILLAIASQSRFSSPSIRAFHETDAKKGKDPTSDLCSLFSRLQARESKWLTRLILKTYTPVVLPADLVYRLYHYLLPGLLKVQNEFPAALHLLASLGVDSSIPVAGDDHGTQLNILRSLRPLVGIKVGLPPFLKGRSIKNCVDMAQNRRMSIEKKYDGEYFQLHIDMSKTGRNRIMIFSKSGRDSTEDRVAVHRYVSYAIYYLGNLSLESCLVQHA